jgi:hypothetical protein
MYVPSKENPSSKTVVIIGGGRSSCKEFLRSLAISSSYVTPTCALVDRGILINNTDDYSYKINPRPYFEEPWIDPHEPVINYRKQEESFAKNRRARKKRNRKK